MGRLRSAEAGFSSKGRAVDDCRAREKATKYSADSSETISLEGCLNVEESIRLHEALAQLTNTSSCNSTYGASSRYPALENSSFGSLRLGPSENLYKGMPSPLGSFNNLTQFASSAEGSSKKLCRADDDIVTAKKDSLAQLLRNSPVRADASKRLVMINVQGSVGPLRALVDAEASVESVIGAALQIYAREGRLPVLGLDSSWFDLYSGHISSSDALEPFQSIKGITTRNFAMVKRQTQCEDVVQKQAQKKVAKPTSWLDEVWGFGSWWSKVVMAAYPAFLQGSDNKSAKAWLHELEGQSAAIITTC